MAAVLTYLKRLLRDAAIFLAIGITINASYSGLLIFSSSDIFIRVAVYNLAIGLSLWRGNRMLGKILEKRISGKVSLERQLLIDVLSTLLFSAVIIFLINYFLYAWLFGQNLLKTPRLFINIGLFQLLIVVVISGVVFVMDFLKRLKKSVKEQEALKREALNHSYEALKNQLSPHFLFNSLSVLSALVEQDAERSQLFIKQLSDVYRYVLEQKGVELVTLEKEMEFVNAYIYLLQIRHDSSLIVEKRIDNTKGYIIPMSLQLLVENALKHNEVSSRKPLTVRIERTDNSLIVSNTIQPRKGIASNGLGLGLLNKRCSFLLGRNLEIVRDNQLFTVILPVADENQISENLIS